MKNRNESRSRAFHTFLRLLATASLLFAAGAASARPWGFVSSRHQAMGGTGVAFSSDSSATYWNPANLAYTKGYDALLSGTVDGNIENDALERLSQLLDEGDAVDQLITDAEDGLGLNDGERNRIVGFLDDLDQFGKNGEAVHFGIGLTLSGRKDGLGFSALSQTTATVYPNTDATSLAVTAAIGALDTLLNCGSCPAPQDVILASEIVADDPTGIWTQPYANTYVSLWEAAGADTSRASTVDLIKDIASQTAEAIDTGDPLSTLAESNTGALVGGLSTQEFGISYGLTLPVPFFPPLDDKIAVAATAKYIVGITYVSFTSYTDGSDAGDIVASLADFKRREVSHNFGLDLAAAYRPFEWLSFGMTARNVNSPEFDAAEFGSIELHPQVRMGMAVEPVENWILAFDFDATQNEIETLPGFQSRIVSLGTEYTIPFSDDVDLALRFGTYSNVSGRVNQDWALTGGLGLRLWQFVMDLSAGGSTDSNTITTGNFETRDIPTRLNLGLTLKWEKSL